MKVILTVVVLMVSVFTYVATAHAEERVIQQGDRLIQLDKFGNKQYHKPSYVIKGDKIIQVDKFGNKQYHKPQIKIEKARK